MMIQATELGFSNTNIDGCGNILWEVKDDKVKKKCITTNIEGTPRLFNPFYYETGKGENKIPFAGGFLLTTDIKSYEFGKVTPKAQWLETVDVLAGNIVGFRFYRNPKSEVISYWGLRLEKWDY